MKITILTIGHRLESFEEQWIDLFHKRLKAYVKTDFIRLNAKKKISDDELIKEIENKTAAGTQVILMDENGKSWSTKDFRDWIDKQENQSKPGVCLVIGESHGFSEKLLQTYPLHISLSKLTFSHNLALLVLFEQLYRIYSWKAGSPYHHE